MLHQIVYRVSISHCAAVMLPRKGVAGSPPAYTLQFPTFRCGWLHGLPDHRYRTRCGAVLPPLQRRLTLAAPCEATGALTHAASANA